ncbi:hypothetical protein NDU88_011394 [Pleurodeles waltl]|uniref:Uncharacterized protein n=1 Tax=Pleurodeles waltl TaxID=8319 RepID=A0AAV7QZV9_PLEWA|nr:hypothetical protein NDU88_011394 [Pleurodeles waltl]
MASGRRKEQEDSCKDKILSSNATQSARIQPTAYQKPTAHGRKEERVQLQFGQPCDYCRKPQHWWTTPGRRDATVSRKIQQEVTWRLPA